MKFDRYSESDLGEVKKRRFELIVYKHFIHQPLLYVCVWIPLWNNEEIVVMNTGWKGNKEWKLLIILTQENGFNHKFPSSIRMVWMVINQRDKTHFFGNFSKSHAHLKCKHQKVTYKIVQSPYFSILIQCHTHTHIIWWIESLSVFGI